MTTRASRLRRSVRLSAAAAVLTTTLLAVGASPAHAATCTTSGSVVTCTYGYTGAAETFTVPDGVSSVHVAARGAGGASGAQNFPDDALGGNGAAVSADLAVSPAQNLVLVVGGAPTAGGCFADVRCIGGFNGGGTSDFGGGGGGASDVRVGGAGLAQRVLVAAGGGGGGESFSCDGLVAGGRGGDAGSAGRPGQGCRGGSGGTGGQPGSQTAGGAGGTPDGGNGTLGTGGNGGGDTGGGGGGGLYGGGGGGDLGLTPDFRNLTAAGGGGGGSNLVPTGGTVGIATEPAAIIITYTLPVPPDTTPPVVTTTVDGTSGDNGWYTSAVDVSFLVVEDESSVMTSGCDPVTVTADGTSSFTCTATSEGGVGSATATVKRDATPPVLAPVVSPDPIEQGGPVSITPGATDATSGIAEATCGAVSTVFAGTFEVDCTATDLAGNETTVTVSYEVVDVTAPEITPVVSGTLGNDNWFTSDVDVSFDVVEEDSPVNTSGCGSRSVTTDGVHVFTCTATSQGGATTATAIVRRDATSPTLDPVLSPDPIVQGRAASIVPNASDATSGVADASCGALSTVFAGTFAVDCTATDQAGNRTTVTVTYEVQAVWVCDSLSGTEAELEGLGYNVIIGDAGGNRLVGTNGADLVLGLGGNDVILTKDGDDVVCGGEGNDAITLGKGRDRAHGEDGRDTIKGDDGNDRLDGDDDADKIFGGAGDDVINGGLANDVINGNDGADVIDGGFNDDTVNGGDGNDTVDGGAGRDRLNGEIGDDTLDGNDGTDRCDGGSGLDAALRCETTLGIP